jgi:hypothetical protein
MAKKITKEISDKYIKENGSTCPFCGGDNYEADGSPQVDGQTAWQEVRCLDCEGCWQDVYTLTSIENSPSDPAEK